jgi:hypothetical protein
VLLDFACREIKADFESSPDDVHSIQFPGSRQYNSFGEIENASDLAEADPKTIVKVGGSRSAVAAAIEELSKEAPGQQQRSQAPREARPDELSEVVQIPKIYQTTIAGEKGELSSFPSLAFCLSSSPDVPRR